MNRTAYAKLLRALCCLLLLNMAPARLWADDSVLDAPPDAVGELDTDNDGIVNAEDNDIDGDSVVNGSDSDMDGDGVVNEQDPDDNNNGVSDVAGG